MTKSEAVTFTIGENSSMFLDQGLIQFFLRPFETGISKPQEASPI